MAATAPSRRLPASPPRSGTGARRASSARALRCACRWRTWRPSGEHSLGDEAELVHGTCVGLGRGAALLMGPPGSGKSDLALRFLYLARRGPAALEAPLLVADDQVRLARSGARILVTSPATIRGKIEVRGIGIVEVKSIAEAELKLVVDLVWPDQVERMPELDKSVHLLGLAIPALALRPWEASAPIKLALALARSRAIWPFGRHRPRASFFLRRASRLTIMRLPWAPRCVSPREISACAPNTRDAQHSHDRRRDCRPRRFGRRIQGDAGARGWPSRAP